MAEKPILFSAPMARTILADEKTVTRRIVPMDGIGFVGAGGRNGEDWNDPKCWGFEDEYGDWWTLEAERGGSDEIPRRISAGDLLWVREEHYLFGHWEPVPGVKTKTGRTKWRFVADSDECRFVELDGYRSARHSRDPSTPAWHKRLARFMPRKLSRITLKVKSVRVERLHAITEEDARAEGIPSKPINDPMLKPGTVEYWSPLGYCMSARQAFINLWNQLNGPGSWESNPFISRIEFERVT